MQSDAGAAWIAKLVEKEANLVAMRALRKSSDAGTVFDFDAGVADMPTSVASYVQPTRESASGIVATFEALWRDIKTLMGKKSKAWLARGFSKKELRRGIESASYAAGTYPEIERDGGDTSLFVLAANLGKMLADKEGLDPAFFDNAIAQRNSHVVEIAADDEDFTLDDLLAELPADEPATDAS